MVETEKKYSIVADMPHEIFRAYDIRGIVEEQLTPDVVYTIGLAVGGEAKRQQRKTICVARDARLSGPELSDALCAGIQASGCDVISLGIMPTPVLYFATNVLDADCGIALTGSHNPSNYNGLKIVLAGTTLTSEAIQALYHRIEQKDFFFGKGNYSKYDIFEKYKNRIVSDTKLDRPIKVVVDCGNGVGGVTVAPIMRAIGCDVTELYCDLDGTFPNHHPDPTRPENLVDLIAKVKEVGADVGLGFDGDADRLCAVTNKGEIIFSDRQMMLFVKDILKKYPGEKVIYDVKSTKYLGQMITDCGGQPILWKTGHSLVKAKLKLEKAIFAGEMSGHIFFNDRWYGFDDGLYTAVRLVELMSQTNATFSEMMAEIPEGVSTPELFIPIDESKKFSFVKDFVKQANFPDAQLTTIDGLRVDGDKAWGLLRASNTTANMVVRFEADSEDDLKQIQEQFRKQITALDETLELPF